MSRTSTLIRRLAGRPVEMAGDDSGRARDERGAGGTNGATSGTGGRRISAGLAIAGVILAVVVVNALSAAHDTARRGGGYDLGPPLFFELTSGAVMIALLPLVRRAVHFLARQATRWQAAALAFGIAIAFSGLHILGMVGLRVAGAALVGSSYDFDWGNDLPYEFRKDLLALLAIGAGFWLIGRRTRQPDAPADEAPEILWLKDGAASIRVEPRAVLTVTSAGNYVEYDVGDRRHLVRGTLTGEETRLAPYGIVRIHRTRLVNLARVVQVQPTPAGDFTLCLDTGATVAGSRRYREAVASALVRV